MFTTPEEDDSYVVVDAATGDATEQKSVEITDAHEVVENEETGSEEDFLAQEEGSEGAEEITKESREGRRGATTTVTTDEDGNTEEVEIDDDDEESEDEDETEREGSCRRGRRRGRRRGEAEAPVKIAKPLPKYSYFLLNFRKKQRDFSCTRR